MEKLYSETMAVVSNPDMYEKQGQERLLNDQQVDLISEILSSNASLFLDEIRGRIYQASGVCCTNQTMSNVLNHYMSYSSKIASKINVCHSVEAEEKYMYHIAQYPAHFLVFTDESGLPSMSTFPGTNSVLVMDNAAIHKGDAVEQLCNMKGVALIYLPAYSPDLNSIKKLFGIFKNNLRHTQGMSHIHFYVADYLEYVIADIMTSKNCHACYQGSGYV